MGWDFHTFMEQPEWFLIETINVLKKQQDQIKKTKK